MLHYDVQRYCVLQTLLFVLIFGGQASASTGDRLPEFKSCVTDCVTANCGPAGLSVPIEHQLLLWTCPQECDYTCQHIITDERLEREPQYIEPIVQFHGKWPFFRFLGMQEPFSVLFSLFNFVAHQWGLGKIREHIPESYSLRKYYMWFGYCGLASWLFSMIFHSRDFKLTERLDYFAAGMSVMYGLYYTPIRIFRLDRTEVDTTTTRRKESFVRVWTIFCLSAYLLHISYLSFYRFDYTYNMAANVAVGIVQNVLWTGFSITRFRKVGRLWAAWPGLIVAWIVLAMSLELFDFPPWWRMLDAHALWHLGTVGPTIWWYNFLVKDAQEDLQSQRLKA
ncbi:hypothetical protein AMS68_000367 [Peltaster fructicola]|uniref:Post-GPI attachment to proteins factor 3 n=1 Tax=Peltaster fructicola TaxID=286661 RepID=A0A6H0XK09_9PEZI|nr:hypothetical protein AMS68_000367 [Peltaster fructicola]